MEENNQAKNSNPLSWKQKNTREKPKKEKIQRLGKQRTEDTNCRNQKWNRVYSPGSLPNIKKIIRKSTNINRHINSTIQMNWTSCFKVEKKNHISPFTKQSFWSYNQKGSLSPF
jgi:hypothetical protein